MNVISFTGSTPLITSQHPGETGIKLQISGFAKIPADNPQGFISVPCQLLVEWPSDGNTPMPRPIPRDQDVWGQPNSHYQLVRQDVTGPEAILLDDFSGDIAAHYNLANQQDDYTGGGRDNDQGYAIESHLGGDGITVQLHKAITPGPRGDNNVMAALKA